jgi:hypothetical protein
MNSDTCLKHFSMLFMKEDKRLLNEVQILGLDYTDDLDDDFTLQEVKKLILSMKNNKATGCDCAEWCSRKERSGIEWLLAGVWQMKGMRRNINKGRCP